MAARRYLCLIPIAALSTTVALTWAQFQTSMQVNPQVNTAIYAGPSVGSMQYAHQNAVNNPVLPSQERFARVQSGMLPSEMRMASMAAGPLAPGGAMSYLPENSQLERASASGHQAPTGAMAAPSQSMATPNGSVRYSGTAASPNLSNNYAVSNNRGPANQPTGSVRPVQASSGGQQVSPGLLSSETPARRTPTLGY